LSDVTSFGGVPVPTEQLFVAALASGAPRPPAPLPDAPVMASVAVDGASDAQIRQGGAGTLVIHGAGLDHVTSARLGDIDVHVPSGAASASVLRLPVIIPHGHAPGTLTLMLGNVTGAAQAPSAVTVTPIVVAPTGSDAGRGAFRAPFRLCRPDGFGARYGDLVLLKRGIHGCSDRLTLEGGVTVRGGDGCGGGAAG
jgi:hypothetical protein